MKLALWAHLDSVEAERILAMHRPWITDPAVVRDLTLRATGSEKEAHDAWCAAESARLESGR